MATNSPLAALAIPPELVCEFFAVFSRFEFAIKDCGFVYVNRGRAKPDWKRFAPTVAAALHVTSSTPLSEAIDFLNRDPPQVQIGAQAWQHQPLDGAAPIETALDAAQRVRHNLFHGGKFTPHSPPGRDERLVRAALTLLLACVADHPALGASYG